MHETVFAEKIVSTAEKEGVVEEISLELGELGHVPPDELVDCVKRLRPDWVVRWKEKSARCLCVCGWSGRPVILERGHDHFLIECPECGDIPDLLEGTDFKLVKVVIQ